jgi:hypothetical protein
MRNAVMKGTANLPYRTLEPFDPLQALLDQPFECKILRKKLNEIAVFWVVTSCALLGGY